MQELPEGQVHAEPKCHEAPEIPWPLVMESQDGWVGGTFRMSQFMGALIQAALALCNPPRVLCSCTDESNEHDGCCCLLAWPPGTMAGIALQGVGW